MLGCSYNKRYLPEIRVLFAMILMLIKTRHSLRLEWKDSIKHLIFKFKSERQQMVNNIYLSFDELQIWYKTHHTECHYNYNGSKQSRRGHVPSWSGGHTCVWLNLHQNSLFCRIWALGHSARLGRAPSARLGRAPSIGWSRPESLQIFHWWVAYHQPHKGETISHISPNNGKDNVTKISHQKNVALAILVLCFGCCCKWMNY